MTCGWLNILFVSLADLHAFLCCKDAVDPSPFVYSFITLVSCLFFLKKQIFCDEEKDKGVDPILP